MNKKIGISLAIFTLFAFTFLWGQENSTSTPAQPSVQPTAINQSTSVIDGTQGKFSEGLAAESNGDNYGFKDTKGHWVIKPQFGKVLFGFKNGLAWVYDKVDPDAKVLIIDRSGKTVNTLDEEVFKPYYISDKGAFGNLIWDMDCKGSPQQCHETWWDRKGEVVFEREIFHFVPKGTREEIIKKDKRLPEDRPAVMGFFKNGKWGLKDRNDSVLLEPEYEYIDVLSNEKTLDQSAATIEETNEDGDFQRGFIVTWKDGKMIQTPADEKQIEEFERNWRNNHKQ